MGGQQSIEKLSEEEQAAVLNFDVSVQNFADKIKQLEKDKICGVVVMAGAGISVSAGIPDFRSPDTGLYANLQKYNLPSPQAIFDISYFHENPQPFCMLAKEMWPGNFDPTPTHFFIKLLEQKGVLRKCFTQNIDTLEREAGIDPDLLVEAHGSFGEAHCTGCSKTYTQAWVKEEIFNDKIPKCTECSKLVKPDIVFFGEKLPRKFAIARKEDIPDAKLLLVMGTSLSVTPFCELVDEVNARTPRMLLNLNQVGTRKEKGTEAGFRFDEVENYRDVALLKDCDSGVRLLCRYLEWEDDLDLIISNFNINKKKKNEPTTTETTTETSTTENVIQTNENLTTKSSQIEEEDMKLFSYNWKKPPPVLPPLQPISILKESKEEEEVDPNLSLYACADNILGDGSHNKNEDSGFTCSLCEPLTMSEVQGGKPAWFRVGFPSHDILSSKLNHDYDYLGLYPSGSTLTDMKTDLDWPFSPKAPADILLKDEMNTIKLQSQEPSPVVEVIDRIDNVETTTETTAAPTVTTTTTTTTTAAAAVTMTNDEDTPSMNIFAENGDDDDDEENNKKLKLSERHLSFSSPYIERPLRLRIPWIHYPLPYDLELWYVDGITNDVLARFGPLTIHENAPNDPKEEELEPGPNPNHSSNDNGLNALNDAEKQELVAKLAREFGLPPAMIASMVQSQMGSGDEGPSIVELEEGEEGTSKKEPQDEKSELRAGFSAFKEATMNGSSSQPSSLSSSSSSSQTIDKSSDGVVSMSQKAEDGVTTTAALECEN